MLDVNSGTSSFCGQNDGRPTTQSAPTTAPDRLPRPPITAIEIRRIESSTRKNRSDGPNVRFTAPSSTPPSPAMNPPTANAMSLARAGDTVIAAAASSFSRTPTIMRPIPVRFRCPTSSSTSDEDDQHEVVVGAVLVRELERSDVDTRDLHGGEAGGEERPVEEVDLRGDGERERADREQEPAHAQRPDADEHRDKAREARAEQERPRERDAAEAPVDDARVVPADVRRTGRGSARRR